MSLNIDKLQKLIALANHNPNENEANLAARKVCSIIEEEKISLTISITSQQGSTIPGWNPTNRQREYYDYDSIFEMFNQYAKEAKRSDYQTRSRKTGNDPVYPNKDWDKSPSSRPKRQVKCQKCGVEKETTSIRDPFTCSSCLWAEI